MGADIGSAGDVDDLLGSCDVEREMEHGLRAGRDRDILLRLFEADADYGDDVFSKRDGVEDEIRRWRRSLRWSTSRRTLP